MKTNAYIILLLAVITLTACPPQRGEPIVEPPSKPITISYHKTVETYMILRAINPNDPMFKYRKPDFKGRPMLYAAREHFKSYQNHPAVQATQNMLAMSSTTGDMLLQGLMYYHELPKTGLKFSIDSSAWWFTHQDSLNDYMNSLSKFYQEAGVERFLNSNKLFYNGAIAEANSHINQQMPRVLEDYFGESFLSYNTYLIPMSPFGMGFAAEGKSEEGRHLFQFISPANDVDSSNLQATQFGYSGEYAAEHYRDLVGHEYVHCFVTPYLEQPAIKAQINRYDSLFIPELKAIMQEQAYNSWWAFVNEYAVRTCEIRIAERLNTPNMTEMRQYNTQECGFVILPIGEELIEIGYEQKPTKFKHFQEFIPEFIRQFESISVAEMRSLVRNKDAGKYLSVLEHLPKNYDYSINAKNMVYYSSAKEPINISDSMVVGCMPKITVKPEFTLSVYKKDEQEPWLHFIAIETSDGDTKPLIKQACEQYCFYGQENYIIDIGNYLIYTYSIKDGSRIMHEVDKAFLKDLKEGLKQGISSH